MVYVIQILLTACERPDPARKLSPNICMEYNVAVCTVENSWWWTEKLSETCRVLFQK